jgi:hypothetical protein
VQHVKIYQPCNFEVNPITHFGVIALFSSVCKLFQKSSLKPLDQFKPNLARIILVGFPLKFMSDNHVFHPTWPPLLKIEIYSNVQYCFILSQNVPKFELYKHNDEFFTYITGFFMNFELLSILTDFAN